jgi:dipicolinate synthase subunit B
MEKVRVGFAFCGSFCTFDKAMAALVQVKDRYGDVTPIVSERTAQTDTRFGPAHEFMREMERICDRRVIATVTAAEPIGPQKLLDVLVIAPCTGTTLAKLALGLSDGPVALAAKAHLRNGGPVVVAIATNDGLSASARNIGELLCRKNYYFVPFRQDDPAGKPTSLVADMSLIPAAVDLALKGKQIQPVLLAPMKKE